MMNLLNTTNSFLEHWEPLWLFVVLGLELVVGLYSAFILTVEYWYDKEFNENMKAARRERRRKKYEAAMLPEQPLNDGEMK